MEYIVANIDALYLVFLCETQSIHILLSKDRIESHVNKDGNDGGSDGIDSGSKETELKGKFSGRLSKN